MYLYCDFSSSFSILFRAPEGRPCQIVPSQSVHTTVFGQPDSYRQYVMCRRHKAPWWCLQGKPSALLCFSLSLCFAFLFLVSLLFSELTKQKASENCLKKFFCLHGSSSGLLMNRTGGSSFISWRGRQGTLKQSNQNNTDWKSQIQEIPQNWTGKPTPVFPGISCYVSMQNTQQEVL